MSVHSHSIRKSRRETSSTPPHLPESKAGNACTLSSHSEVMPRTPPYASTLIREQSRQCLYTLLTFGSHVGNTPVRFHTYPRAKPAVPVHSPHFRKSCRGISMHP